MSFPVLVAVISGPSASSPLPAGRRHEALGNNYHPCLGSLRIGHCVCTDITQCCNDATSDISWDPCAVGFELFLEDYETINHYLTKTLSVFMYSARTAAALHH